MGSSVVERLLDGDFLGGSAPPVALAPAARPPPVATAAAAAAAALALAVAREEDALALVRRCHHAVSLDRTAAAMPTEARARVLPTLMTAIASREMLVPLVRNGVLSMLRRWLAVRPAAGSSPEQHRKMQLAAMAVCEAVAPASSPAYLQQSRGLGKVLLLLSANAQSAPLRDRAAAALHALLGEALMVKAGSGSGLDKSKEAPKEASPEASCTACTGDAECSIAPAAAVVADSADTAAAARRALKRKRSEPAGAIGKAAILALVKAALHRRDLGRQHFKTVARSVTEALEARAWETSVPPTATEVEAAVLRALGSESFQ